MAIDPVCGMEVEEKTAAYKSAYHGKEYFFCAPGCKRTFDQEPQNYVGQAKPPAMPSHHTG